MKLEHIWGWVFQVDGWMLFTDKSPTRQEYLPSEYLKNEVRIWRLTPRATQKGWRSPIIK